MQRNKQKMLAAEVCVSEITLSDSQQTKKCVHERSRIRKADQTEIQKLRNRRTDAWERGMAKQL